MEHEHIEQQCSQRETVGLCTWEGLTTYNLGSHKAWCPQHAAASSAIDRHIIVITDQYFTIGGIEKHIAEGDIAITKSADMQLKVAFRQLEASDCQRAKGGLHPALH